jgi:SAM-dependent methyltransferase
MAHVEQIKFCKKIQNLFPEQFQNRLVLDVGSLDINGNNKYLFDNCVYLGLDIGEGKNVDIISKGHELTIPDNTFDTIISTECFEHDMFYEKTLRNIYRMLKPGGFFIFTCATTGRPEHGTRRTTPQDASLLPVDDNWSDYYKNLTEDDFNHVFDFKTEFSSYKFETELNSCDIYFYGFKQGYLDQSRETLTAIPLPILKNKILRLHSENIESHNQLMQCQQQLTETNERLHVELDKSNRELASIKQHLEITNKDLENVKLDLSKTVAQLNYIKNRKIFKILARLRLL